MDDPVSFVLSSEVKAATRAVIATMAGPGVLPEMVQVKLEASKVEFFAGGRRLLSLVTVFFRIAAPIHIVDVVVDNLLRYSIAYVTHLFIMEIQLRGRSDLAMRRGLFVQSVTAFKAFESTTTTPRNIECPPHKLCTSQSCDSCSSWRKQGLECQELLDSVGYCVCSCFDSAIELNVNDTISGAGNLPKANRARKGAAHLGIAVAVGLTIVSSHIVQYWRL